MSPTIGENEQKQDLIIYSERIHDIALTLEKGGPFVPHPLTQSLSY